MVKGVIGNQNKIRTASFASHHCRRLAYLANVSLGHRLGKQGPDDGGNLEIYADWNNGADRQTSTLLSSEWIRIALIRSGILTNI